MEKRISERKAPKFELKRETIQRLDVEELSLVGGADATAACCAGCDTTAGHGTNGTYCNCDY